MRKYIGYALIVVAVLTLLVWAISQFVQPLLPTSVNGGLVLLFVALLAVTGVLAQLKDVAELLRSWYERSKQSEQPNPNNDSPLSCSLFTRLSFLDNIADDSNADELQKNVNDLIGFIQRLKHGSYFVERIKELTYRPMSLISFGDEEESESRAQDEEHAKQYRSNLRMARNDIYRLIQELLELEK